jgi:hypothetical protein
MDTTQWVLVAGAAAALVVVGVLVAVRLRRPKVDTNLYHFRCPGCRRRLRYRAKQVGNRGSCSHCKKDLIFPPLSKAID